MIYGIEGQFGSGKTSTAVYLAKQIADFTVKLIGKNKISSIDTLILSNIKMDEYKIPNYIYFNDDKFLEVLRSVNLINDLERILYGSKREDSSLTFLDRNKFTKFYIMFDEVGAIMNNRNYKDFNTVISEYINQNRKNFTDIYIITADGQQSDKSLRRFVDWWFYVHPLANFPILRDFAIIRRQKKDDDGNVAMEYFLGKDEKGDYITKTRPLDFYHDFYYKPFVWNYYNDLHKNIQDKEKYSGIDNILVKNIVNKKIELINAIKTEDFLFLENQLNIKSQVFEKKELISNEML